MRCEIRSFFIDKIKWILDLSSADEQILVRGVRGRRTA